MSEGSERRGSLRGIVACAAAAMFFAAIYVGSYLALTDPIPFDVGSAAPAQIVRAQNFRYGGRVAHRVYWPLTRLDKQARPDYWGTESSYLFVDGTLDLFLSDSN